MAPPTMIDLHLQSDTSAGGRPQGPVLVAGLGKTGLACVRHLRTSQKAPVVVVDTRAAPPGLEALAAEFPDVAVHLGSFDRTLFERASAIVLSPGVSPAEAAVAAALEQGTPVLGEIELFARAVNVSGGAPVAAISGSNGKSTVTSLLGTMARAAGRRAAVGGNLGTPALELLASAHGPGAPAPELYILELSSFQLETTSSLNARVATVLNLSPDHLDRHGSFHAYAAAKARIFKGKGVMVLNLDDPTVAAMARAGRDTIGFSVDGAVMSRHRRAGGGELFGLVERDSKIWLARARGAEVTVLIALQALPLPGRHNAANALAALAMGSALGFDESAMLDAVLRFDGLAHRCQLIAARDGVRWFNDSKGTNVGATAAAIEGVGAMESGSVAQDAGARVVLIAGGDGKGADFSALSAPLARHGRCAVLMGRDARLIERAVEHALPVTCAGSLQEAVAMARDASRPGDCVLFSPACASFDMFENYVARGEAFTAQVRALLEGTVRGCGGSGK